MITIEQQLGIIIGMLFIMLMWGVPVRAAEPQCQQYCILPPKEFDKPYTGKLTIETVATNAELRAKCDVAMAWSLGCAFLNGDSCHIILIKDKIIRARGWSPDHMLRHEIGHCNGWPSDHPGQRRFDAR